MHIVLIGPPGSGKGTQSDKLAPKYHLHHVSIGALLRESFGEHTTLSNMVKGYMSEGKLMRDEVVDALLESILRQADYQQGVLFDGFPRTRYQANFLDQLLDDSGHELDAVIYLNVSDEEVKRRLPGRVICRRCHTPYHRVHNPFTICHRCGSKQFYRRTDDNPETVQARLRVFHRETAPLLKFYQEKGKLFIVKGEGTIDQVYQTLVEVIEGIKARQIQSASWEDVEQLPVLKDVVHLLSPEQAKQALEVVLLGSPGSGKGTQAEVLSKNLNLTHISTGDLFRNHLKNKTKLGILAKSYLDRGELVPDDVTVAMVRDRLLQLGEEGSFILDGFPRTIAQAKALTEILNDMQRRLSAVLYINVSNEEIVKRLSGRIICQDCQTPYHVEYNPPLREGICNSCNGKLRRRDDDNPETVRARLRTYYGQTAPLIDYYTQEGILREINGEGKVDEVVTRIVEAIEKLGESALLLDQALKSG
jgi:adenylate kinase